MAEIDHKTSLGKNEPRTSLKYFIKLGNESVTVFSYLHSVASLVYFSIDSATNNLYITRYTNVIKIHEGVIKGYSSTINIS